MKAATTWFRLSRWNDEDVKRQCTCLLLVAPMAQLNRHKGADPSHCGLYVEDKLVVGKPLCRNRLGEYPSRGIHAIAPIRVALLFLE